MNPKLITVKVGSNVLTRGDGTLDITRMSAIVDQVVELNRRGIEVILVSSGAVASGRSEMNIPTSNLDSVSARQLFSAVGQAKLMNRYFELFRDNGTICGQVLTTKEFFQTRTHYRNQKRCMEVMLENKVVPIVNENDTISLTELMFTDNDELSGLVAKMMDADMLIILSNIDGIFNGDPADKNSKVIREIMPGDESLSVFISDKKSTFGRGGMRTKCGIAQRTAAEGISVIIANGRRENILLNIMDDPAGTVCTRFEAAKNLGEKQKVFAKRRIFLTPAGTEKIISKVGESILTEDIADVSGEFFKDEVVRVISATGEQVGVGKTLCSNVEILSSISSEEKPKKVIHYDYLFLD